MTTDNRIAGTRIGVFEIHALLGRGGMGEVYRARDTRLDRDVALKLLPRAFTEDADRVSRFEREARVLASLNHPNIGAVYGLEESDGVTALVMELVDGEDLSERLARGSIRMREALTIAKQIAEALEVAHEQGIVHRDLKPQNIRLRRDGAVKVLDFGLAKALTPADDQTAMVTGIRTHPGLILGTPAYMSPEQARGEAADRQADIWSFGVVLYELLTGVSPFVRPTVTGTLASVLEGRVELARLPAETPAAVRHVLRRCLDPDRKHRLQHIGDARIELEESLIDRVAEGASVEATAAVRRRRWWLPAATVGLAALAGAAGWLLAPGRQQSPPVVRLSIASVEFAGGGPIGSRHLAISPDGSRVAFITPDAMLIRDIGNDQTIRIPVSQASGPFFSPDGNWVGLFGQQGGEPSLLKVSTLGGIPVPIVPVPDRSGGGTWSRDGSIVFASTDGLYHVPANGGEARLLAKADPRRRERGYAWPEFLPDGRSVLFTIVPEDSMEGAQIAVLDIDSGELRQIVKGGSAATYVPSGHLVYASGETLKAIRFDAKTRTISGVPVTIPNVAITSTLDNGAAEFAVSPSGALIFVAPGARAGAQGTLAWVDRNGKEEPLVLGPDRYGYARISPDGTKVALDISGANRDIWIWDLRRSSLPTRLTDGPSEDTQPVWSADGSRIFFSSNRGGNFDIYSQAADGATGPRLEWAAEGAQHPQTLTPDARHLLVGENYKDLSILTFGAPNRLEPILHSAAAEWLGAVSPDGHWIAYESNEAGDRMDILLRPFPDVTGRREKISSDGGRYPVWGPKGSGELYYVDLAGHMMSASLALSPTSIAVVRVTKLFDFRRPPPGISNRLYDVSPVDGRFLTIKPVANTGNATTNISVVLNWSGELRRIVP